MSFDYGVVFFLNHLAESSPFMKMMTVFFAQYFPYLIAVVFLAWVMTRIIPRKDKLIRLVEGFGAALIARVGVVVLIRAFVSRTRPYVGDHAITAFISETSHSFPSGHATFFFALSTTVYLHNKRLGIWFYMASFIMGLARVATGVHYPTDILGGAILGIAVGWVTHRLVKQTPPPRLEDSAPLLN